MPFCFPTSNIVTCILCMDYAMAMHVQLLKNTKAFSRSKDSVSKCIYANSPDIA